MTLPMNVGDNLFVYGSLRRGEAADLSEKPGASFLKPDSINGLLYTVSWYPGAKVEPGCYDASLPSIKGDVFSLDDDQISHLLDAYEGYPTLFDRVETVTASGLIVWVYTYNAPLPDDNLVPDGDWLNRPRLSVTGGF